MSQSNAVKKAPQQQAVDFNAIELVDAHQVFPDYFQPGEKKIARRMNRHSDCIKSDKNYVPDERALRRFLAWWNAPAQLQAFGLVGETGTGKTELMLYVADHLNEPVHLVKCHAGLMPEDLEGSRILIDGKTPFQPGPAVKAYSNGGLLIFDEIDKINPTTGAALHGLLEGKPWPVEQIGVNVVKHRLCRIATTGNTTGEGGNEHYTSSQRMDDALRSRIGWIRVFYPQPSVEMKILEKKFKPMPVQMRHSMVRLATELRKLRVGEDGKGVDDPIGCVFSTRTLVNWGFYTMTFGLDATWRESFDFATQGGIDPESQDAVDAAIQRIFDKELEMTIGELKAKYTGK
jgi:cobaltochelatase CobS